MKWYILITQQDRFCLWECINSYILYAFCKLFPFQHENEKKEVISCHAYILFSYFTHYISVTKTFYIKMIKLALHFQLRMCKNSTKYFCIHWCNCFSIANLKENKMHTQWNLWSTFSIRTSSHWINIPTHDGRVEEHQHEMRTVGQWRGELNLIPTKVSLSASVYFLCFTWDSNFPSAINENLNISCFWTNVCIQ